MLLEISVPQIAYRANRKATWQRIANTLLTHCEATKTAIKNLLRGEPFGDRSQEIFDEISFARKRRLLNLGAVVLPSGSLLIEFCRQAKCQESGNERKT